MGVTGLTGFIDHHALVRNLTFSKALRDTDADAETHPHRLVIDGSSLVHHLYFCNLDWAMGGQYHAMILLLDRFFGHLAAAGIEVAMVVFDGGRATATKELVRINRDTKRAEHSYHAMKAIAVQPLVHLRQGLPVLATGETSSRNRRSFGTDPTLPVLAISLAMRHMRDELKVPVRVAEGEADRLVALEANRLDAYALGNDSDYYIYALTRGYIRLESVPFDGLDAVGTPMDNDKPLMVQVFTPNLLASTFNTLNPHWFPVLACALGNDYVPEEMFASAILRLWHTSTRNLSATQRTRTVGQFLRDRVAAAGLSPASDPVEALVPYVLQYIARNPAMAAGGQHPRRTVPTPMTRAEQKRRERKVAESKKLKEKEAAVPVLKRKPKVLSFDDFDSDSDKEDGGTGGDGDEDVYQEPPHSDDELGTVSALKEEFPDLAAAAAASHVDWKSADPKDLALWAAYHPVYQLVVGGIREYLLDNADADQEEHSKMAAHLPAAVIQAHREGRLAPGVPDIVLFKSFICKPVLEDINRGASVWSASRAVRVAAYRKLGVRGDVIEHGRFHPGSVVLGKKTAHVQDEPSVDEHNLVAPFPTQARPSSKHSRSRSRSPSRRTLDATQTLLLSLSNVLLASLVPTDPPHLAPTLDLMLATLCAHALPVLAKDLYYVRITARGQHWASTLDSMLVSMYTDPDLARAITLPMVDHPAVHYYLARIAPLAHGVGGEDRTRIIELVNASVPEANALEMADHVATIQEWARGTLVPAREPRVWERDEARVPEDGKLPLNAEQSVIVGADGRPSPGKARGASGLTGKRNRTAQGGAAGEKGKDTLAKLGLAHLFKY
ncbi:hypothetical protein BCR44DRAFT_64891 [Catenaria anguillulae PL171]|uniref:Uncharacterized protein n=1 Tax=Catenaria anguillulae PL171 TaxID=765915 RepID=A0A1Y2H7D3_9FUNG|nr:hypothetical protein BCR44DRAFT_64891 [Catenaria anguillulae PL171]